MPAKSSPQALKRESVFSDLTARVELVPFPNRLETGVFPRPVELVPFPNDSWQALKTGVSTRPGKVKALPSPSKATIVGAEPRLFVADIKRSCKFFCEKLGCSLVFSYGRPAYYAQVGRDAARLNLRCVERPVIESTVRDRKELLSVTMTVATADEIKLLFLEFQSAGVRFRQKLKKQQPWGAKNFVVADPDGNLLLFADRQADSRCGDWRGKLEFVAARFGMGTGGL